MRGQLQIELGRSSGNSNCGDCSQPPGDVILSDNDVVQPDLIFVSHEREHLLNSSQNVRGSPDLVIEILSPSTADKDRGYKRTLYAKHGVAEYWLVDPLAETIQTQRQRAGALTPTGTFGSGDTLWSPQLPRTRTQSSTTSSRSDDTESRNRTARRAPAEPPPSASSAPHPRRGTRVTSLQRPAPRRAAPSDAPPGSESSDIVTGSRHTGPKRAAAAYAPPSASHSSSR